MDRNGKWSEITRGDFLAVAGAMGIKKAGSIIDRVNGVVQNWSKYAKETGVAAKLWKAIKQTLITI